MEDQKVLDAMKSLLNVKEDRKIVDEYAREKFNEWNTSNDCWYCGFEILGEGILKVKYGYGMGDIEMNDDFTVVFR